MATTTIAVNPVDCCDLSPSDMRIYLALERQGKKWSCIKSLAEEVQRDSSVVARSLNRLQGRAVLMRFRLGCKSFYRLDPLAAEAHERFREQLKIVREILGEEAIARPQKRKAG